MRTRGAWRWPAVAGSLILHALALGTLPRVAPPEVRLEAPVVDLEVLTTPEPLPPAPDVPSETRPKQARPPVRRLAAPEASSEAPDASLLRMRPLQLLPEGATLDSLARDGAVAIAPPVVTATAPTRERRPRWQDAAATHARQERARANVRDGRVHPQYYDLLRDAEKAFKPPTAAIEQDPRSPSTAGKTVRGWLRGFWRNYTAELERQGKNEPAEPDGQRGADRPSDLLRNYNRLLRAAKSADQPITCRVCMVFRPGEQPNVILETASGNREIDRLAVDALSRALGRRLLETDLLPGRADPESVCYRFEATMGRIPPVPVVGCGFEETTLEFGCYYPLMKTFKTDVKLDGVHYRGG